MIARLRPYQNVFEQAIYAAWAEAAPNILGVAPTGSGKTVIFSNIIRREEYPSVAIAHRQELVSQISLALARNEVRHRVIGPSTLTRTIARIHLEEVGRNYLEPRAGCAVAGVDTLIRMNPADPWFKNVRLGVQDEAHHMLRTNKWGRASLMFPNARWLGVTATPNRADGIGLGRHADGIFDRLVLAPSMRNLIRMGYLTDYRIYAPTTDIDLSQVGTTASGDFSPEPLRKAVHKSRIVGDVVAHYLRIAPGKLGVTFAVDVESATEIAGAFNAAGVVSRVVSATTPDHERVITLRKFRNREIMQLVNVDLFGEGFDLPAIEVVSMARPTQSYPLFAQQFGRVLRVMVDSKWYDSWDMYSDAERLALIAASSKPVGIVIDHVGNVFRHGLPDATRHHTLNGREKRERKGEIIPVRICPNPACAATYERIQIGCPYCGHVPVPAGRGIPEQVDGDLCELDAATLARLRGEIDAPPRVPYAAEPYIVRGIMNRASEKAETQTALRHHMALWAGRRTQSQDPDSIRRMQKEFFLRFGVDVLSAQALARAEAAELMERIKAAP